MQYPKILLCIVPPPLWDARPVLDGTAAVVQELIQEVQSSERRLRKGVTKTEEPRFSAAHELLQAAIRKAAVTVGPRDFSAVSRLLRAGKIPAIELGCDYFETLVRASANFPESARESDLRLAAATYSPEQVPEHLKQFERLVDQLACRESPDIQARLEALRQCAATKGCGLVELVELDSGVFEYPPADPTNRARGTQPIPNFVVETMGRQQSGEEAMKQRLSSWIDAAINTGMTVNASNQSHVITTEVMSGYVVDNDNCGGRNIRIVYGDGSEAQPFPLRCLKPACFAPDTEDAVLRVGLISIRHLEMDSAIDMAWFRNRETSESNSSADSDEFCFRQSVSRLAEMREAYTGRHLTIRAFHTGLEPAVIGFYRAVVKSLSEHQPQKHWLRVIPTYFLGDGRYVEGRAWPSR